jgi:signal transduction histidine kinase
MKPLNVFQKTRFRIAAWYTTVMGLILIVCAIGVYQAILQERTNALEQKLEILLGTLHDSIEPLLTKPGRINAQVAQILPGLCRSGSDCSSYSTTKPIHTLGIEQQNDYYIRFFNPKQQLIAAIGQVPNAHPSFTKTAPRIIDDRGGQRYVQVSLDLKTQSGKAWGYLELGRSLQENDQYLRRLRDQLFVGLPLALGAVAIASWGLAGRSMRPVYRSYQQMQQFTADAAHELRTPLAAIQSTIDATLREPMLSEDSRPTLQAVQRQSRRLAKLTQDLLLLSRFDLQQDILQYGDCDLNDLVEDLVEEFSAFALELQVNLSAQLSPGHWVIAADGEKLYQVVTNLIINAIQHTPMNGKVIVKLARGNSQTIVLQVIDTGGGIAATQIPHLFNRFYRIDQARSRHTGGTGLGLAIAQAIVQAHQGEIQVSSQPGTGSQFSVILPISQSPG